MTCEGVPLGCSTCYDSDGVRTRASTRHTRSTESEGSHGLSDINCGTASTVFDQPESSKMLLKTSGGAQAAVDTPPESPSMATTLPIPFPRMRRDSSFRKTYDDEDRKRAIPCDNCALTIPTKMKQQIPDGGPGSPLKNGLPVVASSPILRTRVPYARVPGSMDASAPHSQASSATSSSMKYSGVNRNLVPNTTQIKDLPVSRTNSDSTVSSVLSTESSSSTRSSHSHYMEYTSSHDPQSSQSFSALRASCLRTLSCETLPPSSSALTPHTPGAQFPSRSLISNSVTGNGGPIFFGDSATGYTTAFIFRVPDPYARGRRRIYAFICLTTIKEGRAMQAFGWLSKAFRELASWIQGLAEVEADRVDSSITSGSREGVLRSTSNNSAYNLYRNNSASGLNPATSSAGASSGAFGGLGGAGYSRRGGMNSMGGGAGPYMNAPKSRGLAELVGRPDFFLDLHARFVALSAQMSSMGM